MDTVTVLRLVASLGRQDAYGQYVPPLGGQKAAYWRVDEPLTEAVLERHLNGGPHAGLYMYPRGENGTRLLIFDLDDHEGRLEWGEVRKAALDITAAAARHGLHLFPIRSGGGRGCHLAAHWIERQIGRYVRAMARRILAEVVWRDDNDGEIRYHEGAGGLAKGEIEILPKGNGVGKDGYGTLVALPFGRKSVPLNLEMLPTEQPVPWPASAPVPPAEDEPPPRAFNSPAATIEDILAALTAIPNDGTTDYDEYIGVGMATAAASGGSEEGFAAWDGWAQKRQDKYDRHDARRRWPTFRPTRTGFGALVKRARRAVPEWRPPSEEAPYLSDQWLALRFVAEHGTELRYTALWSRWHLWDGDRWARDTKLRVFSLAQEHCRKVARSVDKKTTAAQLTNAEKRAAVVSLAREHPSLAMVPEDWDADPWLLGTPRGVTDLRTGELLAPDPLRYVTMITATAPHGDCPLWRETLHQICDENEAVVGFLKRWFGYCLTGLTREEKMLFFLGDGANGKGTVIETIVDVMGEYAVVVAMTTLVQTRHQEHPTEIAKLFNARLAVASETSDGGRINAARVKLLTGGDKLTGRFMRADFFDFSPTHKLVISGNRPLILGRRDRAIERRWNTVLFNRTFAPDTTLKERLRAEASGILAWLIEGCIEWQRAGLGTPEEVKKATEAYLDSQDDLGQFIADECIVDPTAVAKMRPIYEHWRQWCERSGVFASTFSDFQNLLRARFKVTITHNVPHVHGLRLDGFGWNEGSAGHVPL